MNSKLLGVYLNDHLAGAVAGRELAARALSNNRGNDFGTFLGALLVDIESDKEALEGLMERLEIPQNRPKQAVAWAAEKAGRLKLNGRLGGYSPLSRLLELEALTMGVEGKGAMWRALEQLASVGGRLAATDFHALAQRAADQRRECESHRLRAAQVAFGDS